MNKPLVIWKGGRPRKAGPREPSGRPARNAAVLPPGMTDAGLAVGPADYRQREVTERGQVIGRTVSRIGPLDKLPMGNGRLELDGDEWKALAEYERRHRACDVQVKCHLNRTPGSGDGLHGVVQHLRIAIDARNRLRLALPGVLWSHLERVLDDDERPDMQMMKDAAKRVLLALDGERKRGLHG